MKSFKNSLSGVLIAVTIVTVMAFGFGTEAEAVAYEKAIFPAPRVYLTQIAYESYSHGSQNAIDISPGGNVFAPFTGTIVQKDANWGFVLLQSNNKVYYADGSLDYMTVGFMHDSNISDLYVGQKINQGQNFYQAGGMGSGNPNAYGVHVHLTALRGKVNFVNPYGNGNIYAYNAFYVNTTKTQIVYPGKVEAGNRVNNGAPTNYNGLWKTTASFTSESDTQKPTISNVKITNLSASGYNVTCTVSDNVGVAKVAFPTWTHHNGQDDLIWRDGSKNGGTYTFRVNKSEHNWESEWYATHIYAYDAAGNISNCAPVNVLVPPDGKVAETTYNGKRYVVYKGKLSRKYAKELCEEYGGHLARITSAGENAAVAKLVAKLGKCWIDGSDAEKEGVWKFSNGAKMTYFKWNTGEPNNYGGDQDFLAMGIEGAWDDADPTFNFDEIGFVCEFEHKHTGGTATCKTKAKCVICGSYYGSLKSHTLVTLPAKAATYKSTGLTAGKKCKVCNTVTVKQKVVAMKKLGKVYGLKALHTTTGAIKVTWNKVAGAEKYEIKCLTENSAITRKVATNSISITGLDSGVTYNIKVKAVSSSNKGAETSITTSTKPAKAKIKSLKSSKKKIAVVSLSKVTGATDYEVQYSTTKSFKKKTTKTTKSTKLTIKKLKSKKNYYVRVRAYRVVNGVKFYGSWSSVKSIKVK